MTEEMKLTDEEIVKALDICYNDVHCSVDCPYFNLNGRNFCQDKELYKDLKRIVLEHSEQKAEIERLTKLAELRLRDNEDTCKLLLEKEKQVDELKEKSKEVNDLVKEKVKDTAKEIVRLIEFHSVATMKDGIEYFTISALGLKEILHENFEVDYNELYEKGVEVE